MAVVETLTRSLTPRSLTTPCELVSVVMDKPEGVATTSDVCRRPLCTDNVTPGLLDTDVCMNEPRGHVTTDVVVVKPENIGGKFVAGQGSLVGHNTPPLVSRISPSLGVPAIPLVSPAGSTTSETWPSVCNKRLVLPQTELTSTNQVEHKKTKISVIGPDVCAAEKCEIPKHSVSKDNDNTSLLINPIVSSSSESLNNEMCPLTKDSKTSTKGNFSRSRSVQNSYRTRLRTAAITGRDPILSDEMILENIKTVANADISAQKAKVAAEYAMLQKLMLQSVDGDSDLRELINPGLGKKPNPDKS